MPNKLSNASDPSQDWEIFRGDRIQRSNWGMPDPPPWRRRRSTEEEAHKGDAVREPISSNTKARGSTYQSEDLIRQMVNAALHLRRPLLVTGSPGSGKSSLIDAVAFELDLGEPLRWPVNSHSTLREGLYAYDAIGRVQSEGGSVGDFVRLGPLGTAMLPAIRPRALLIDEIDKADIDLPNDLLNIIEEAYFDIPELARAKDQSIMSVRCFKEAGVFSINGGKVESYEFPLIVMTSNGERDFPAPFLRRCLRVQMPDPCADPQRIRSIVQAHLGDTLLTKGETMIQDFISRSKSGESLATDQLLNAILLTQGGYAMDPKDRDELIKRLTEAVSKQST